MKNLIDILTKETQSLKIQYIEKILDWANKYYDKVEVRRFWLEVDWCKHYGLEPIKINEGRNTEYLGFPRTPEGKDAYYRYRKEIVEVGKIYYNGREAYLNKKQKFAELHYESSIIKLAKRIQAKELNIENLKVETSHIGVNINTTLTDGIKTVKAFTIIASGEIQQPHYRYLVK